MIRKRKKEKEKEKGNKRDINEQIECVTYVLR